MWGYTDLAERARIRAEAVTDPNWPPKIAEFVVDQDVEVVTPFPFIPDIKPAVRGCQTWPVHRVPSVRAVPRQVSREDPLSHGGRDSPAAR